jgi:hypothetical protein
MQGNSINDYDRSYVRDFCCGWPGLLLAPGAERRHWSASAVFVFWMLRAEHAVLHPTKLVLGQYFRTGYDRFVPRVTIHL